MDIASIIAIALLLGITLWWVLKPLWEETEPQAIAISAEEEELIELEQRRDGLYKTIKDLEQDLAGGKISEQDYNTARSALTRQAAVVLKEIDSLTEDLDHKLNGEIDRLLAALKTNKTPEDKEIRQSVRAEIMAQARQISQVPASPVSPARQSVCHQCAAPAQADDAFCRQCGASLHSQCPNCQHATAPDDAFCAKCGTRLAVEVAE